MSSVFPPSAINAVKENFTNKNRKTNIITGLNKGPLDLLQKILLSLSFFQPKSLGGTVAKTIILFDIMLHHCQGERKGLSLMFPSRWRKGGVVGKNWLIFVVVFHVNNLFVPLSYTFHCYYSPVVHFLISFLILTHDFHLLCLYFSTPFLD